MKYVKFKYKFNLMIMGIIIFSIFAVGFCIMKNNKNFKNDSNEILQEKAQKGFFYKIYDNIDDNNIKILVTAKDDYNDIQEVTYKAKNGTDITVYASDNKNSISFDYIVKKNEIYHFEMKDINGQITQEDLNIDDNFVDCSDLLNISIVADYESLIYMDKTNTDKISYKLENMSTYTDAQDNGVLLNGNDLRKSGASDEQGNFKISFIKQDANGNKIKVSKNFNIDYYRYREQEIYIQGESLIQAVYDNQLENGNYTFLIGGESYPAEVYNYKQNLNYKMTPALGNGTADSRMLIIKCEKNITINSGVTITPQTRKKGFFICAVGNISNSGTISMTARGANAVGQNVYLWKQNNSYNNFTVPANGASGGASASTYAKGGIDYGKGGYYGQNRQTGGGGSGCARKGNCCSSRDHTATSGAGSSGTSYSGGTGGGATYTYKASCNGSDGASNGGAGGNGYANGAGSSGGGAGNPGGSSQDAKGNAIGNAETGTGGLLIMYSKSLENYGTICSNGSRGAAESSDGGSSGAGSINIFTKTSINAQGNIQANSEKVAWGGAGGHGCISKDIINIEKETYTNSIKDVYQNSILYEISCNTSTNNIIEDRLKEILSKYGTVKYDDNSDIIGVKTINGELLINDFYNGNIVKKDLLSNSAKVGEYVNYLNSNNMWRIMDKSGGTIRIIRNYDTALKYSYSNINVDDLNNNTLWLNYVDNNFAESATGTPTKDDIEKCPEYISNNGNYWLATVYSSRYIYVCANGHVTRKYNGTYGIRPVVVLKNNLYTKGRNNDGAWVIENEN